MTQTTVCSYCLGDKREALKKCRIRYHIHHKVCWSNKIYELCESCRIQLRGLFKYVERKPEMSKEPEESSYTVRIEVYPRMGKSIANAKIMILTVNTDDEGDTEHALNVFSSLLKRLE